MYALIHNSQLILGPIQYNYRMINSELEELEIGARVTPRDYENIPIRFDDLTFLVPVSQIIPEHDTRFQSVGNFTWEIIRESDNPARVEMTYPISNKTLEQIKEEYKKQLPDIRRQKETQIIDVTINDTIVQVSTAREERVSFVSKLVSSPGPHNFKFENNVWLQITTTELEYVISQIDAKVQEAFDWEYTKVQEIDACETGEDVYNVVIVEPVEEVIPNA